MNQCGNHRVSSQKIAIADEDKDHPLNLMAEFVLHHHAADSADKDRCEARSSDGPRDPEAATGEELEQDTQAPE